MRGVVKRAIERGLVGAGAARWGVRQRGGQCLVLAYHNIVPDDDVGSGDASLHLPIGRFAEQLDAVTALCDVVPLGAVLESGSAASRPRVVVTFDDAYRGAVTLGVGELVRRGLPATIFVVPGYLGRAGYWWDRYRHANHGMEADAFRAFVLDTLRGDGNAVDAWADEAGIKPEPTDSVRRVADVEELDRAARSHPGLAFASHSWSHPSLVRLTEDALAQELTQSLGWLRDRGGGKATVPWLSYPYGLWSPAVERAANEAGYAGAVMVSGGWVKAGTADRFAVPRLNIPSGLSIDGFLLRLAGFAGG